MLPNPHQAGRRRLDGEIELTSRFNNRGNEHSTDIDRIRHTPLHSHSPSLPCQKTFTPHLFSQLITPHLKRFLQPSHPVTELHRGKRQKTKQSFWAVEELTGIER
jgi:hypothetical protein